MKEKKKNKRNRLIISVLIILALLSLSTVIIHQYIKYNQIEERLDSAYSGSTFESTIMYTLFPKFNEAEYLFRMYAINFRDEDYFAYTAKLDTIQNIVDSLAKLPIQNNPIVPGITPHINPLLADQYLTLKKKVDDLIFYAKDTIIGIVDNEKNLKYPSSISLIEPEDLIRTIANDTLLKPTQSDTLVRKRGNIFDRIFRAKDDTLVSNQNILEVHRSNQLDLVLRKNINTYVSNNEKIYNNSLKRLKSAFEKLKVNERKLLISNLSLLSELQNGINRLREIEFDQFQAQQESDFLIYKENTKTIRLQLLFAISLMLLMVVLILSYQRQVYTNEQKLISEKNYADKIAEEKSSVLANISHEIRAPLNSLKGLVNILKSSNTNSTIDDKLINSVFHNITVINTTINDILSLSKLEAGSSKVKHEKIDIHSLIDDLVGMHFLNVDNQNIELINDNQLPKSILIRSNPFRIKQIVSNLITNAIKYTEAGHIKITSQIHKNTSIVITVEDTGIGISQEQMDHVFRKYYIVDNEGKSGSFGLGLYISKILSEQIGGKLSFKSKYGHGTTFTLEIPIVDLTEIDREGKQLYSVKDLPKDLKILFVDDSKINLFFVEQLFKDFENVHFFNTAKQALEYIQKNPIDILITDLKMPKISGWDLLIFIKSDPEYQHIKVFASTAEPLLLEHNNGQYQFDGIINKPIQEDELVYKICYN